MSTPTTPKKRKSIAELEAEEQFTADSMANNGSAPSTGAFIPPSINQDRMAQLNYNTRFF